MQINQRYLIEEESLSFYGKEQQIHKTIEELNELAVALAHYIDGKASHMDVITELADVEVMLDKMKMLFGEEEVRCEIARKLLRLKGKMSKEKTPTRK